MQDTLQVHRYLDRCNATAGWTELGNDTTNLATTTRCVNGAAALEFDKVDGAANTKLAGVYRTVDFNVNNNNGWSSVSAHDVLEWWVYVSAKTNVDYTFVRIGTDASNYVEFRYEDDEMTAGRFTHCAVPLGEYSTLAGTGCNWTNIDYLAVGVAFDAETDALADIAIDSISIIPAVWAGNSVSFGDVDAEVTLDSEGIPDAAAPSHALQVGAVANAAADTPDEGDMGALSMNLASELRTRTDSVQAAVDAAAPSERVGVGFYAETTVPTAVADGDLVDLDVNEYGNQRLAGYDRASNSILVTDTAPAKTQKLGPLTFTQLTAAGSTAATNVANYSNYTWQVVVASINTSVTVRAEGSLDNSNWFNLDDSAIDTTYTANGTYCLRASNRAVKWVRFTFVSEVGGAAATLDVDLYAGN